MRDPRDPHAGPNAHAAHQTHGRREHAPPAAEQARPETQARHEHHAASGTHTAHEAHAASGTHGGHDKHAGHSVEMFRNKFWISLALTIPTVVWGHMLNRLSGFMAPMFPGSAWIPAVFGTAVFFYGDWSSFAVG